MFVVIWLLGVAYDLWSKTMTTASIVEYLPSWAAPYVGTAAMVLATIWIVAEFYLRARASEKELESLRGSALERLRSMHAHGIGLLIGESKWPGGETSWNDEVRKLRQSIADLLQSEFPDAAQEFRKIKEKQFVPESATTAVWTRPFDYAALQRERHLRAMLACVSDVLVGRPPAVDPRDDRQVATDYLRQIVARCEKLLATKSTDDGHDERLRSEADALCKDAEAIISWLWTNDDKVEWWKANQGDHDRTASVPWNSHGPTTLWLLADQWPRINKRIGLLKEKLIQDGQWT